MKNFEKFKSPQKAMIQFMKEVPKSQVRDFAKSVSGTARGHAFAFAFGALLGHWLYSETK